MKLEMQKSGTFKPDFLPNSPVDCKCDIPEADIYRYQIVVIASAEALDAHGFIVDNVKIQEILDTCFDGKPFMSCERMAIYAVECIAKHLLAHGAKLYSIQVAIMGSNGALLKAQADFPDLPYSQY